MSDSKIYTRKEISRIFTKASGIQAARENLSEEHEGLTHEELLHLAEDAGINTVALEEAILNYDNVEPEKSFNWINGSSKIQKISVVEGKLTDEKWGKITQEIRRITGGIGKVNKGFNTYEWEQRRHEIGYRHFTLTEENGKTRIQYTYSWWGLNIYSTLLPFITFLVITAAALDASNFSDTAAVFLSVAGGLTGIPVGRLFLRSYFNKQKQQAENLFSAISGIVKGGGKSQIHIEDKNVYRQETNASTSSTSTKTNL